jgi:hypothetical protein
LAHRAPNATVLNAVDGSVAGTIDLGGAPEQAVTDSNGHLYVDIEDKANVAVIDANTHLVSRWFEARTGLDETVCAKDPDVGSADALGNIVGQAPRRVLSRFGSSARNTRPAIRYPRAELLFCEVQSFLPWCCCPRVRIHRSPS